MESRKLPARRTRAAIARALCLIGASAVAVGARSIRLPSNERLFVMQGGDMQNVNPHMLVPSQLYAVDLAIAGGQMSRELSRAEGKRVDDYFGWHTVVVAPVTGPMNVELAGKRFEQVERPLLRGLWLNVP